MSDNLKARLLAYEGKAFETTACYNGLRDEAAKRIEALGAEVARLMQERAAATATAYEAAAHIGYITCAETRHVTLGNAVSSAIRALATPDQLSALDRVRAEAKAEGMREAARIARVEAERLPITLHDAALKCETAILAAIPKEGV